MSFRDYGASSTTQQRRSQPQSIRNHTVPAVRAMPLQEEMEDQRTRRTSRPRRPIVLHGRVQRDGQENDDNGSHYSHNRSYEARSTSVRKEMERRSVYAQLLHETEQYQKTVAQMEQVLPEAGENPEAAWRAKILMRSAQAVDQELWNKLYNYEKTLYARQPDPEVRQQQTACMKLHRDFKRSHKALVLALTMYEKTQRAEISRLGAVGWSEKQDAEEEEDFYTKAMRERQAELDRMNYSMHQVKDLYKDLGFLIQKQQEPIDKLEDRTEEARTYTTRAANVRSLWEELFCFADRDGLCQPQQNITLQDGKWKVDGEDLVFKLPSCGTMAFESFQEALPESFLPPRKVTASESSIISGSEYTEESPRGVLDSVSALSDDMRFMDDMRSHNLDHGPEEQSGGSEDERTADREDDHWLMRFENFAADLKAVQSDLVHFGKEVTSEVMAHTNLLSEKARK